MHCRCIGHNAEEWEVIVRNKQAFDFDKVMFKRLVSNTMCVVFLEAVLQFTVHRKHSGWTNVLEVCWQQNKPTLKIEANYQVRL